MFHHLLARPLVKISAILLGSLTLAVAQADQAPPGKKESKPQLRIICVASLSEDQETILASRDDEGNWQEHGAFELRSSFITDWMPADSGELHLALRNAGELKSICRFTCPAATKRNWCWFFFPAAGDLAIAGDRNAIARMANHGMARNVIW